MLHNTSSISSSSLPFSLFSPCSIFDQDVGSDLDCGRETLQLPKADGGVWESHVFMRLVRSTHSPVSRWDFFSVSALFYSSFTFSFLQQSLCLFHPALLSTLKCRPSPPFLLYALLLLSPFLLLFDFFCRPLDEALLSLSCCTLLLTPLRSHSCM